MGDRVPCTSICVCRECRPARICTCAACEADRLRGPDDPLTQAEKWLGKTRDNPFEHDGRDTQTHRGNQSTVQHRDSQQREEHILRFSYAILNHRTIGLLRTLQPLLEVGTGLGYWAAELTGTGVNIIPTSHGEHWVWRGIAPWLTIEDLDSEDAVRKYPDRNLLMCWPDLATEWPVRAARSFEGETLILVGENQDDGCTSYDEIAPELEKTHQLERKIEIPQFYASWDDLEAWRRIPAGREQAELTPASPETQP